MIVSNTPLVPELNKMDNQYKKLLQDVLENGSFKEDRTGLGCYSSFGHILKHDMSKGFPLLTVRKVPFKSVFVELEGFIKGISSKKWYQKRGCKLWDEWCNPQKVPYSNDPETKAKMLAENDLGIIYGNNWRDFHDPMAAKAIDHPSHSGAPIGGVDQLVNLTKELKANPNSRRMVVTAWNPLALEYAALPACHDSFQVAVDDGKLNLGWRQRSCDLLLGIPSNIASYATLLHLLAKESGFQEGKLVGFLGDVHLYSNQIEAAKEYIKREPFDLPLIETENFTNIFNWTHDQTKILNYKAHPRIKVDVAV